MRPPTFAVNSQCAHGGKEPLSKSGEYMHVSGVCSVGPAVGRGAAVGWGVAVGGTVGVRVRGDVREAVVVGCDVGRPSPSPYPYP